MKFAVVFTTLAAALSASAIPLSNIHVNIRAAEAASDVWDPKITNPSSTTVWPTGSKQNVTWDTTGIPENALDTPGVLYLGHIENDSENLDILSPLAKGFKYRDGTVEVTVPNVDTRPDYVVALLGDSGNISPKFTISKEGDVPSNVTSALPSGVPTGVPSDVPTSAPTGVPTDVPSGVPTGVPTNVPSGVPSSLPTDAPTAVPSSLPTDVPTGAPSSVPTDVPSVPSAAPTVN